ncbi:MAG: amidohydrolase, partial [Parvularculaceae bacterium]|nr:amidohydrolase [Parvularculaceae bacterium]
AVRDGKVLAVGARGAILPLAAETTETIDLGGAALYPGFVDSHAHLLGIGLRELTLNLEGVTSIDELVDIVAAEVAESEPGAVISGRGWIESQWPEKRFPTRADLDPASPNNPVILYRGDGHALVANSAALARAKITAATKAPDGGRIERDAKGAPTGVLVDNAMALVEPLIGVLTETQKEEAYAAGAKVYAEYGWTGLHNMSVDPADLPIIERLAAKGAIPIRVYNALDRSGMDWLAANAPHTDATGRVITRAVKLYADGALGSRGAALEAPYADDPSTSGLLLMKEEDAEAILDRARDEGIQVATHAIGDRANHLVLGWYRKALEGVAESPRWRIEHAQIIDPADIPRFARDKIIASMQPSHAISDFYFAPARLGPDRLKGAYAWKSLLDAGAVIAGGSDAPVERGDPRIEFYAAVARRSVDGFQGPDWRPEEAVSRAEALAMFTKAPAYASFQENELGTIEPGKRAD